MELWPLRLFSSRLSSACPGTQRGRMAKVSSTVLSPALRQSDCCKGLVNKLAVIRLTRVQQHVVGRQVLLSALDPSCFYPVTVH